MMKKILVIGTKEDGYENISTLLKELIPGCSVIGIPSASEGIEKTKTLSPDIVFLDTESAEMDGHEACNRLKSDPGSRHIPTIMMIDNPKNPDHYHMGLKAGADAFLDKPVEKAQLNFQIKRISRINTLEDEISKLRRRLQLAQKMEAIGTLAGGIVHEFNNILFPIIGYTEMSMYDLPEDSKTRKNLASVLKAADRAKDLVQQILNFSRKEGQERKSLKIQYIIKETLKLLKASLPSTIEIRQDIDNACGPIKADPSEIQQVLMNLCTNAYQAMEQKGGVLEVTLSEVDVNAMDLSSDMAPPPGSYLQLTVKDTGCGIEDTEIKHIFNSHCHIDDPDESIGTGLGIVYEIVRSYQGNITVDSQPNQWTMIKVYLPLHHTPSEKMSSVSAQEDIPSGNGSILLVDDEEYVVEMMHQMLERLGYQVISKISSIEALEVFRREPEKFDLVVTDQTMPRMTGMELIKELILIRPDVPIILCTGFNEKITEEDARHLGIDALISKPVRVGEIAEKIRKVMDINS